MLKILKMLCIIFLVFHPSKLLKCHLCDLNAVFSTIMINEIFIILHIFFNLKWVLCLIAPLIRPGVYKHTPKYDGLLLREIKKGNPWLSIYNWYITKQFLYINNKFLETAFFLHTCNLYYWQHWVYYLIINSLWQSHDFWPVF